MRKTKSIIRGVTIFASLLLVAIPASDSFAIGVPIHPPKPVPPMASKPLGHPHSSNRPEKIDDIDMVPMPRKGRGPANHNNGHGHPPHFSLQEKCKDTPGIIDRCKK
jgi:hypothetical protein